MVDGEKTLKNSAEVLMNDGFGSNENSVVDFEPSVISSISILEGKNAQLDCVVKNKGSHQVNGAVQYDRDNDNHTAQFRNRFRGTTLTSSTC